MKFLLTITTRKERLSAEHLGENAAYAPDIDSASIFLECQHDFGGTVPTIRLFHKSGNRLNNGAMSVKAEHTGWPRIRS